MKKYLIVLILVAIVIGVGFAYWQINKAPSPVACTEEAKVCPDGVTSVGRQGPNCEFAPCPAVASCEGGECPVSKNETKENIVAGMNLPDGFIKSASSCFQTKSDGVKIEDSLATKIEDTKQGISLLICNFPVDSGEMSKENGYSPITISGYPAQFKKFVIRGGGRAYYYIEKGNDSTLFIDAFWSYPDNSTNDEDLKPKEEIVENLVSSLKL